MVFVDGENFTIRGQELASRKALELREGEYYSKDTFLWVPNSGAHTHFNSDYLQVTPQPIRSFYYTSVVGDAQRMLDIRGRLWALRFQPVVFEKKKQQDKAKGVDIALTKDMLTNAFLNNYDVAVLFAGDGDYVPVVEEVKRLGRIVDLVFFASNGLNDSLRLACDSFRDITDVFVSNWESYPKPSEG